jgi:uroporphyrinogen decarboxylase
MDKLTSMTIAYLRGQIAAGADAVQLFDSWLGLLGPDTYASYVFPYTQRIFAEMRGLVPTIHFSTGTVQLLELIGATKPDMVSVDWRLPLDVAWGRLPEGMGIQGNLDNSLLMAPWSAVESGTRDILRRAAGRPGHIFNLGHGLLPQTNPDQLQRIVEVVHGSAPGDHK